MTANVAALHLDGKEVGYVPHSETTDTTASHIYETHELAWNNRRSHDSRRCECGGDGTKVHAVCYCGEWDLWVCLPCKAVVYCPETADSLLDFYEYGGTDEQVARIKAQIEKYKDK